MRLRFTAFLLVGLAAGSFASSSAVGQERTGNWEPARLADGRPDLQGVWDFRTATPFERPAQFGDRETFTEEEAAAKRAKLLEDL